MNEMDTTWLKDDSVRLRTPEPEDLELMYAMENDTTLWSAGNATLPYTLNKANRTFLQSDRHVLS